MKDVLPKNAQWINDFVIEIDPKNQKITTKNGDTVNYEILIVALGLKLNWQAVEYRKLFKKKKTFFLD